MKAILASKIGLGQEVWDRFTSKLLHGRKRSSALSLEFVEMPEPTLPSPEWVKIRTIMSAISDMDEGMINGDDPGVFGAYVSFPFVPGNEMLGIVTDMGEEVQGVELGERVVVNPLLSCEPRGINPVCSSCAAGNLGSCRNFSKGIISPGIMIGACKDTNGGWGDYVIAHKSQVKSLPQTMESDQAILIPEYARALTAVLKHPPAAGERVIIIGGSSLGLLTLLAMKRLMNDTKVLYVAHYPFETEIAQQIGHEEIITDWEPAEAYEAVAEMVNGSVRYPEFGRLYMEGGADIVYETSGKVRLIEDAVRFTAEGKKLVLMGINEPSGFDMTPIWFKNVHITATIFGGRENFNGKPMSMFDLAIEKMSEHGLPYDNLITHRFRLEQFKEATDVMADRGANGAIKLIFQHVF